MRLFWLSIFIYLPFLSKAQTADELVTELRSINGAVAGINCQSDSAMAISHRAMNVFMADKTGYLTGSHNLSYYTNYVFLNTAEGRLIATHSFQPAAKSNDEPLKHLLNVGFDITLPGNYAKSFLDKRFEAEMAITLNYTWLGKVSTRLADCGNTQNKITQQQAMNALRAALIEQLRINMLKKEADVNTATDTASAAIKKLVHDNEYAQLKAEYEEQFAIQQAALLSSTLNFKTISTHWTALSAHVPLLFPKYTVAPSLTTAFNNKNPYPLAITLAHTRMWESAHTGRLFITLEGNMQLNNSKLAYGLSKMNFSEYKSLGGTAAAPSADPGNNRLYIGQYSSFVTPSVSARMVYFPSNSHVGLSFLAEQSFGDYNLLNCKVGIPIVLINSKKTPAVVIECYALFCNLSNKASGIDYTIAGLSIGIPFSRLMF